MIIKNFSLIAKEAKQNMQGLSQTTMLEALGIGMAIGIVGAVIGRCCYRCYNANSQVASEIVADQPVPVAVAGNGGFEIASPPLFFFFELLFTYIPVVMIVSAIVIFAVISFRRTN